MFRKSLTLLAALSMSLMFVACGGEEPIGSQAAAATDRVSDHVGDHVGDRTDQVRDRLTDRHVSDRRHSDRTDRPSDHRQHDVRITDRFSSDRRIHDAENDHRLRDVHSARDFLDRLRHDGTDHAHD